MIIKQEGKILTMGLQQMWEGRREGEWKVMKVQKSPAGGVLKWFRSYKEIARNMVARVMNFDIIYGRERERERERESESERERCRSLLSKACR